MSRVDALGKLVLIASKIIEACQSDYHAKLPPELAPLFAEAATANEKRTAEILGEVEASLAARTFVPRSD